MTGEFLLTGLFFAFFLRKFEKSSKNIWWFQKKSVPLHSLKRTR